MLREKNLKVIYIKPNEEIISVIDKLVQEEEKKILLVMPSESLLGQSLINLRLLKREAENLGIDLSIFTNEPKTRFLIEKAGINFRVLSANDNDTEKESLNNNLKIKLAVNKKKIQKEKNIKVPIKVTSKREKMVDIIAPRYSSLKSSSSSKSFVQKVKEVKKIQKTIPSLDFSKEPVVSKWNDKKSKWHFVSKWFRRSKSIDDGEPLKRETILSSLSTKLFLAFVSLACLVAFLIFYLILPRAEINLVLNKERVTFVLPVLADKDFTQVDTGLDKIPLQVIQIKKSKEKEFITTGEEEISKKAHGIITVYNAYSSSPQTLVATTRFLSEDGKLFRTTKTIVVPGAEIIEGKIVPSTCKVEVIADQAGPEFNIGPTKFTIPGFKGTAKYNGFYGRSEEKMEGGIKEKARVVSEDDMNKAKEALSSLLKKEILREFQQEMPSDLKLLTEALSKDEPVFFSFKKVGDKADKFVLKAEMTMKALLFNEQDINKLVDDFIKARLESNRIALSESRQIEYTKVQPDFENGKLKLEIKVNEDVSWELDTDKIKNDLAGKDGAAVRHYLSHMEEIKSAQVSFWPFWVRKVPKEISKIKITIEE